jgi:hypothetical protein
MYNVKVIRIKFTTISKISNTNQMLIIPFLSIHYIIYTFKKLKVNISKNPLKNQCFAVYSIVGQYVPLLCSM